MAYRRPVRRARYRRMAEAKRAAACARRPLGLLVKIAGQLAFAKKASSPCPVAPAKVASLRMSVQ